MKKELGGIHFDINSGNLNAEFELFTIKNDSEVKLYRISLKYSQTITPEKISITFHIPKKDIFSVFKPNAKQISGVLPDWNPVKSNSSTGSGAPIIALIAKNDNNRVTAAFSDCKTPCRLTAGFNEAQKDILIRAEIFTSFVSPLNEYETLLYIDLRDIPAYRSISDVCGWWKSSGHCSAYLPESAMMPIYAPWYVFQQNFRDSVLLEECRRAKELGMEAIIIDDGWQTENTGGGYAFCGDWKITKNKIRDMSEFVRDLHDIGIKVILWFSVPFVGKNADSAERFKGRYLYFNKKLNTYVLDPRFPDVREYLISTFVDFLCKYDLDGFKLDFIDAFYLTEESPANDDEMDYAGLEDAVEALIGGISERLKSIKPEILLEFRQHYTGAIMQRFGNMFRIGDCPGDAAALRVGTAELRMLTRDVAVHSDPLIWNYNDPVEYAAYQLNNSIFSVPQISLNLGEINEEHRKMLLNYLRYFRSNRKILLFGELIAEGFAHNYTRLTAKGEKKEITILYGKNVLDYPREMNIDLINATGEEAIYIRSDIGCPVSVEICDCMGNVIESGEINLHQGFNGFIVPISGFMYINGKDRLSGIFGGN